MTVDQTFIVEDFTYKILSENEVIIGTDVEGQEANAVNGDNSYSRDVYIPNYVTYKGIKYAVTQVGNYAFFNVQSKNFVIGRNIEILGVYAIYNPSVESILFEEESKCYKINHFALSPSKTKENFTFFLPSSINEMSYYGIGNILESVLIYYCGSHLIDSNTFAEASKMTIYVTSKYPGEKQFMGVSPIVDDSIVCEFVRDQSKGIRQASLCKRILSKIGLTNSSIISTLFCSV